MAKTRPATGVAPSKAAEELTKRYVETLRRLQGSLQKRLETAARGLASTPEHVQTKARNDAIELVDAYIQGLRDSLGHPDAAQRLEVAVRSYVLGLQRIAEEAQKDVAEGMRDYATALRELPTDVQRGIQEAYAEYTSSLQERVTEIDFTEISPQDLIALGQSMATVAMHMRAALGK